MTKADSPADLARDNRLLDSQLTRAVKEIARLRASLDRAETALREVMRLEQEARGHTWQTARRYFEPEAPTKEK